MKVFCIISDERAYRSKSPALHTRVLKQQGIEGVYVPFAVESDRVEDAIRGLKALGIAGANVTVPYKETVVPYLDELSAEASSLGAVNTIVMAGNSLMGHNTDIGGCLDALAEQGFDAKDRSVLVTGTGGAAKAVLHAIRSVGAQRITLAGRDRTRVARVGEPFDAVPLTWEEMRSKTLEAQLVVNATTVSSPEEAPDLADLVNRVNISDCELIMDLNYGRQHNFWNRLADRLSARFVDGLPMLAFQACRSFSLWTGLHLPGAQFKEALEAVS